MAATVIVIFTAKEGMGDQLAEMLSGALPHMAGNPECTSAVLHRSLDNSDQLIEIQQWTSAQAHKDFLEGLKKAGVTGSTMEIMAGWPVFHYAETIGSV